MFCTLIVVVYAQVYTVVKMCAFYCHYQASYTKEGQEIGGRRDYCDQLYEKSSRRRTLYLIEPVKSSWFSVFILWLRKARPKKEAGQRILCQLVTKTRMGTQTPPHSLLVTPPTSSEKTGEQDTLGLSPPETHLDVSLSGNEGRAMIAISISVYSEVFRGLQWSIGKVWSKISVFCFQFCIQF